MSGLGHSVRSASGSRLKRRGETAGTGRQASGEVQGRGVGLLLIFHRAWPGWEREHAGAARPGVYSLFTGTGDRRPPRPCRLAYGGGTPAGRGLPAALEKVSRPRPIRPSRPSVGQSPVSSRKQYKNPSPSLSLICPHILLYCPLLEANSSYPSLSCCLLGVKKR